MKSTASRKQKCINNTIEIKQQTDMGNKEVSFEKQVQLCTQYLKKFAKKSNTYYFSCSYGLKHYVERYFRTYIDNDALIEAGRKMFESKRNGENSPNYIFKLKLKNNGYGYY